VTFASNTAPVCTVSGVTVTLVAVGTCSITASQPGNSTYAAATPVTQTFPINSGTATCVSPPSGMIAWWTLDETSGTIAKDSVGAEPAAYFGAPVQTPGLVGGALKFNGSTDFLSAADSNLWAFGTNDFTIELWASFTSPGGGSVGNPSHIFIGNDEGPFNLNKWFFALGGGFLYFHVNSPTLGPSFFPPAPFSPALNQWYHLAVITPYRRGRQ
jgi:hypothetical protein